jgi:AhpD family alkylhydroperoxidase
MTQRLKYAELAPEGVAKMRATEHYLNTGTALGPVLLELVRLRASEINGCEFCVAMHRHELAKHHEPLTRVDAVAEWWGSDAFTPRERAALAWAESVTRVSETGVPDADFAAVSEFFEGKDLVDLTMAVAMINAWNRLAVPFRMEWNRPVAKTQAAAGEVAAS